MGFDASSAVMEHYTSGIDISTAARDVNMS